MRLGKLSDQTVVLQTVFSQIQAFKVDCRLDIIDALFKVNFLGHAKVYLDQARERKECAIA